jgi:hypothetical protein
MEPAQWLESLKGKYLTQEVVLDGMDDRAREQNLRLFEALKRAGERIDQELPNNVYGLFVKGSRIKGYHSLENDLDLIVVSPADVSRGNIYDILHSSMQESGLSVPFDGGAELWEHQIEKDEFLYQVDNEIGFVNCMFGHQAYANPNLLLARLAALDVIKAWKGRFDWDFVRKNYNDDYLGTPSNDIPKIARRLGVGNTDVKRVLTRDVYRQRFQEFSMPEPEKIRRSLMVEYRTTGRKVLEQYDMFEVLQDVRRELKEGF